MPVFKLRLSIKYLFCCLSYFLTVNTSLSFSQVANVPEKPIETILKEFVKITGIVSDSLGNPIPNAIISMYGHPSIGTRTDSAGKFVLNISVKEEFGICIDHICYCAKHILIHPGDNDVELNIVLNEALLDINFSDGTTKMTACGKYMKMPVPKLQTEEEEEMYIVMELPEFRGGVENLIKIFNQEKQNVLSMQKASAHRKLKGLFYGFFVVDKTGYITKVSINKKVSPVVLNTLNEIFSRMGKWKPGIQLGFPVDVKYSFVVEF